MSATLGNLNIGSMYAGSRKIAEAWLGNVKVFGSSSPGPSSTVKIGGRDYPFVQIGNQLWITENLDWKFDGLTFRDGVDGNDVDPSFTGGQGCYYNYDESTYGSSGNKCGMLYDFYAVTALESLLPTGWHVPTDSEWDELFTFVGGKEVAAGKLKTTDWNGTDDYGFSALPGGMWANGFGYSGTETYFWTAALVDYLPLSQRMRKTSTEVTTYSTNLYFELSIRLCCSAP